MSSETEIKKIQIYLINKFSIFDISITSTLFLSNSNEHCCVKLATYLENWFPDVNLTLFALFSQVFHTKNTLKCCNSSDHFRSEICPPWKLLRKLSAGRWLDRKLYIIRPLDQSKVWNSVHVVYEREVCSFLERRT